MPRDTRHTPLLGGAAALHAGDQSAMAALPLTAVLVLGGAAPLAGALLAAQAAAWLLCSIPAGLAVDRLRRGPLLGAAAVIAGAGLALAALGAAAGHAGLLGAGAFLGASGTVLFVLAAGAAVPDLVGPGQLAAANARLELARALASLAAPPLAGALAAWGRPELAFAGGTVAACAGWALLRRLPPLPAPGLSRPRLRMALAEGAAFLRAHALLRGIALCAVFWNLGFFALLAAFVPFALGPLGLTPAMIGLGQAGYGAGLVLGAAAAPRVLTRFGPRVVLIGGPGLSLLAPLVLLLETASHAPLAPAAAVFAAQLLLGFGPMMWLVCQQSIRQAVVPRALLGRVGAALQVAIYGVRPAGALAGGLVAEAAGPGAGLALAAGLFALSLAAVCCSALARLRRLPVPLEA